MKKIVAFALKTTFFSLVFFIIFLLYLAIRISLLDKKYQEKVYPHVYINGINFSGREKKEVEDYFRKKNESLKKVKIVLIYQEDEIATFSGQTIKLKFDEKTISKQAYAIGRTPQFLSRIYQKIRSFFNLGLFNLTANFSYRKEPVVDYLNYLREKHDKPAENALFQLEDGRVSAFRTHQYGLRIKKEKALEDVDNVIRSLKNEGQEIVSVLVDDQLITPQVTLSSINNFGIVEKIGEGKSDFTGSASERVHNIILSSSKFHGVLIEKGAVFSFNQTVGDISSNTGYKPAYIIKGGKTVLGDGGGVCQVSTTLFRAALDAGLPIVERVSHAYRVYYYEHDRKPGFDATVFAPSVDLKFKNNTPAHILIQTEVDQANKILKFSLYGKKDGRIVQISDARVWDVLPPPEPLHQEDPTLKKGVVKQIDWAAWGAKSVFHYKVEKEGKIIQERDFYSSYRPWQAVYLVGTAE